MGFNSKHRGTHIANRMVLGDGYALVARKFKISSLTTGEKDTGFDFPAGAIILDVIVDIDTPESTATTKTIDVGLLSSESGGDTDGFLDGVSTATAGSIQGSLANGAVTFGLLQKVDLDGVSSVLKKHAIGTAKSLVYQLGSAHTELVGTIRVVYLDPVQ